MAGQPLLNLLGISFVCLEDKQWSQGVLQRGGIAADDWWRIIQNKSVLAQEAAVNFLVSVQIWRISARTIGTFQALR